MADYDTHFSCLLNVHTPENAAHALDLYTELSAEAGAENPLSNGFLMSVHPDPDGAELWVRDDANGDPDAVIMFVKRCVAAFGLTGPWGFQYAHSCSKPRLDGFGGGARVIDLVTGEELGGIDTDNWLAAAIGGGDAHA